MAENRPMNDSTNKLSHRELCRYFVHGVCRFGDNCFNSHDLSSKPNTVCRYYLAGSCSYGDRCFYDHDRPKAQQIPTTTSKKNSEDAQSSEADSASTSPSTESTLSNEENNNPSLVRRYPKNTQFKRNISISDDSTRSNQITNVNKSPSSYFEALTGKEENLNEFDMNLSPFDENYNDYLNTKRKDPNANKLLCPYYEKTLECPYEFCDFVHGNICDICNMACLNPLDEAQAEKHQSDCMDLMEKEMEEAFAVQRSSEKLCGICMEIVWNKENECDKRFGILENCNHVFCLPCIRKWRASKSYENKIVKACPECRVKSDFITPNKFWFEDEQNKKKIIQDYKLKLGTTACKYFKQGDGECPFGSKCFYLHRYHDGTKAELPEPKKRHRFNQNGLSEAYSTLVTVDFDFSDDETDDFDILEFFRNSLLWENEESDSNYSNMFELSDELS